MFVHYSPSAVWAVDLPSHVVLAGCVMWNSSLLLIPGGIICSQDYSFEIYCVLLLKVRLVLLTSRRHEQRSAVSLWRHFVGVSFAFSTNQIIFLILILF